MNKEYWKDIPEFEGLYEISTLGNIKRVQRYVKNRNGYRLLKEKIIKLRTGLKKNFKTSNHNGENNPNSKLTKNEVIQIMNSKLNGLSIKYVYENFKNKISFSGLEQIWYGYRWNKI